jgi:hypothetical protein
MKKLLEQMPWFVTAPAAVAVAVAMAIGANVLLGPYFERSFLDEASPLAGNLDAAGNGSPDEQPSLDATPVATPTAHIPGTQSPTVEAPRAGVIRQGEWQDGEPGHNGSGIAQIIRTEDGGLVLRVEEFSVTNGPDLIVVLSTDDDGYAEEGRVNLGALKATDGNFNYDIPTGTDIFRYKSVVVWCQSFPTTFAYATLEDV